MGTGEALELGRVTAAARLWGRSAELVHAERALFALQGCFPRFDAEATLLKVVALAALDSSRSFAVARWAEHAETVMAGVDPRTAAVELVDRLAAVPGTPARDRTRAVTLASRFAHYFVDVDRFPILDAWSERELARTRAPARGVASRYAEFAARHAQLASELGLRRARSLWCCLWLSGQCRAWSRNARTPIHRAARALFETGPAELELLVPHGPARTSRLAA